MWCYQCWNNGNWSLYLSAASIWLWNSQKPVPVNTRTPFPIILLYIYFIVFLCTPRQVKILWFNKSPHPYIDYDILSFVFVYFSLVINWVLSSFRYCCPSKIETCHLEQRLDISFFQALLSGFVSEFHICFPIVCHKVQTLHSDKSLNNVGEEKKLSMYTWCPSSMIKCIGQSEVCTFFLSKMTTISCCIHTEPKLSIPTEEQPLYAISNSSTERSFSG